MLKVNELTCDAFDNIDDFANEVELQHNSVHGAIGGAMGNFDSPAAAIFWLWHAKVDDMYHCFQEECQDCEPVFIRATGDSRNCDFCFDFGLSSNLDEISITLIDDNGNETIVPWTSSRRCIPYTYLESGVSYTAIIHGTNDSNENCIAEDEISFEFTAPVQPPITKFGNPCLRIIAEPQFPIPGPGDDKFFKITNNGSARVFNFKQVQLMSGQVFTLEHAVEIGENQDFILTIPRQYIATGNNALIIEVDGQTMDVDYIIIQ